MRYVIKGPTGYFTEMKVVETRAVTLNGNLVGHENVYRPQFEAFKAAQASQFDTEGDATALMADSNYGGAEAFAQCSVEKVGE